MIPPASRIKILLPCMLDSIHSVRWLEQFSDEPAEFILFPSSPNRRIHPFLKELLARNTVANYKIFPMGAWFGLPLWVIDRFTDNFFRGNLLRWAIRKHNPNILHALELQNAGYISLKALIKHKPKDLRFIVTNWGSDIFWFQRFPKHRKKLEALLGLADDYSAECHRDLKLATVLGFSGKLLPVIPNAGGFSRADLSIPISHAETRKIIAVKGYHGWVGRARVALHAFAELAEMVSAYRIVVYSANWTTRKLANKIARKTGLDITTYAKGALSHKEMLELFAKSKIYVGISKSDGISTSMLEAMAMGAIPVQTSTACIDEWFQASGVAVDVISVQDVKVAIARGLALAENPSMALENRRTIEQKARGELVREIALTFYS